MDTPEGVRSGSSVYEIWANWSWPGSQRRIWGERGEAVTVDLPKGQTLFSLLKTGGIHGDIASMVLATLDENFDNTMVESTQKISLSTGSDPIPIAPKRVEERYDKGKPIFEELSNYPAFVTFRDINDPASAELVDPDDLEASFGKGYKLNSILV